MSDYDKCQTYIAALQEVRGYSQAEAYAFAFGAASVHLTNEHLDDMIARV